MKWITFYILLGILLLISCNRLDNRIRSIESDLELIREKTKVVGFSIAVIKENRIVYSKGFGYRDLKNKLPVDKNTLFPIGSCTKAFTSTLLGIMSSEGKLRFDDKPRQYFSELEFWNDTLSDRITLNVMSRHGTGLPRYEVPTILFPIDDRDDLVRRVKYYKPKSDVGKNFIYNNHMYALLGVISERIDRKSWQDLIREKIFTPLDMSFSNSTIEALLKSDNSAFGYTTLPGNTHKREEYLEISVMGPAGAINSSAVEMANWLKPWLNNGEYKGKTVIFLTL